MTGPFRPVTDDTQPCGTRECVLVYEALFDSCDREHDYKGSWAQFQRRFGAARGGS